jgi:hypothetical protein
MDEVNLFNTLYTNDAYRLANSYYKKFNDKVELEDLKQAAMLGVGKAYIGVLKRGQQPVIGEQRNYAVERYVLNTITGYIKKYIDQVFGSKGYYAKHPEHAPVSYDALSTFQDEDGDKVNLSTQFAQKEKSFQVSSVSEVLKKFPKSQQYLINSVTDKFPQRHHIKNYLDLLKAEGKNITNLFGEDTLEWEDFEKERAVAIKKFKRLYNQYVRL